MDRNEYLQMAQKCSILDFVNIPEDLLVVFNGIKYMPYGYDIRFKEGKPIHNAILRDLNANSLTYAILGQVDKKTEV